MKQPAFLFGQSLKLLIFLVLYSPQPLSARFLEEDADQIDPEERLGLETYNDLLSYRYPAAAWLSWDDSDSGFRANAGSLNANRFLYAQDIKFNTGRGSPGSFSFRQSRREDVTSQRTESEIRATMMPAEALEISIMGDSGIFKEFGDLGLVVGFWGDRQHWIEAFYWSVDHYYNTKKSDPGDQRNRRIWSSGLRGTWRFGRDVFLYAEYEFDVPLNWDRESKGFTYTYQRQSATLRLQSGQKTEGIVEFATAYEQKQESKDWRNYDADPLLQYKKNLARRISITDLTWMKTATEVDYELGTALFLRRADYAHELPTVPGRSRTKDSIEKKEWDDLTEAPSPNSRRVEEAVFGSMNRPLGNSRHHRIQYGFHSNYVVIDERHGYENFEVKTQLAWEYRYSDKASAFINTSWDVDQLAQDFPYRKGNFRPWGGGNMQFTATF